MRWSHCQNYYLWPKNGLLVVKKTYILDSLPLSEFSPFLLPGQQPFSISFQLYYLVFFCFTFIWLLQSSTSSLVVSSHSIQYVPFILTNYLLLQIPVWTIILFSLSALCVWSCKFVYLLHVASVPWQYLI